VGAVCHTTEMSNPRLFLPLTGSRSWFSVPHTPHILNISSTPTHWQTHDEDWRVNQRFRNLLFIQQKEGRIVRVLVVVSGGGEVPSTLSTSQPVSVFLSLSDCFKVAHSAIS